MRIAWQVSPRVLNRIDVQHAVQEFNARLQQTCPEATSEVPAAGEDPLDPAYNAWVLRYDAQTPELEWEMTRRLGHPSRFALDPHNGVIAVLVTRPG